MDILKAGPEDPRYQLSFHPHSISVHVDPKKRVGRPRIQWATTTLKELWRAITRYAQTFRWENFNPQNMNHNILLFEHLESVRFQDWLPYWDGQP
eukprot:7951354-Prorocentrum_lima.AAC.1